MMAFQQINHVADGKQQLHSTIGAQDHAMEQKKVELNDNHICSTMSYIHENFSNSLIWSVV